MKKFTGKKIDIHGWGTIKLFTHEDCKKQAESWRRYFEDFMRCKVDPMHENPKFEKRMRILIVVSIYISTAAILAGMYFQWRM